MGAISLKCYVSTPLLGQFRDVRTSIATAIEEAGLLPVRIEELGATALSVGESVQRLLQDADFVVADLTGGNPNVVYEVGLCHGLRKPVLLLTQDVASIPAALHDQLILRYDVNDLRSLREKIVSWFARMASRGASR